MTDQGNHYKEDKETINHELNEHKTALTAEEIENTPDATPVEEDSKKGNKKKEKKKKTVGQEILSWVGTLLLAVVIAMAFRAFLMEPIRVDGRSMLETLQDGEIVLVTKPAVLMNKLERGDVVIVRFPNRHKTATVRLGAPLDMNFVSHELFVKRLVALPGDSVAVLNGTLYINDAPVQEDFIDYPARTDFQRIVLGEDEYMVMGDNRASSNDSRARDVGPISKDMIVGKAKLVLLPLNKIRTIK
ncbi:MAG: signal peptidase I [Christensenellales bacterium]|jgi:signal peptidase I|nr:signal peptidase I [Clostridiales bacterium]